MFKSVPHILFNTIKKYPDKDALRISRDDQLRTYTYHDFGELVKNMTHALAEKGLKPNDKVAILSNNMPEWTICDFAVFCLRGIVVPIYQTLPAGQIEYILKDSETRAIFVQDEVQYTKIKEIHKNLPKLELVFSFEKVNDIETFDQLIDKGKNHRDKHPDFFEKSMESIDSEAICSLVYTSGTTGDPKGVMLHHKGFVKDIVNAESVLNLESEDVFLSFLPLSHLYERLAGHWCPIYRGGTIHYARSIETIIDDIAVAKPTVMVSVPRLYEKIANTVNEQIEQGSFIKRKLFNRAIATGLDYHKKRIAGKLSGGLERRYRFADKVVFSKIKKKLGGNFRYPIAGGAPLSVDTLKFFEAIGLRIVEGYGMTETHLIITLTPSGKTKYGSCGKPIPEVEVKIAEDGEVLVKGDTLMAGYFNKPELTADMIDSEGWLHTGDIGYLDEDNYLFLTDRKKNIIVTSGGKNVAPAPIEHKIKTSKYIDDVCLVGSKRKFISALVIPNYEMLKGWAKEQGLHINDNEELVNNEKVRGLIGSDIDEGQADFARYEQAKKFAILSEPLSIEKGELTPSLKIKRNVVEERYKPLIDALYQ